MTINLLFYHYSLQAYYDDFFNVLLALVRFQGLKNTLGKLEADNFKKYSKMFEERKILNLNPYKYRDGLLESIRQIVEPNS